jgi:hypothetical protein
VDGGRLRPLFALPFEEADLATDGQALEVAVQQRIAMEVGLALVGAFQKAVTFVRKQADDPAVRRLLVRLDFSDDPAAPVLQPPPSRRLAAAKASRTATNASSWAWSAGGLRSITSSVSPGPVSCNRTA